jgi:hypothetical protein
MIPPVGMTRVGRLRSGRIATRMDGVRSGYPAKTADASTAVRRSFGRDDKGRSRSHQKKCEKCAKSAKSPLLACKLAAFSLITEALLQNFARENIALRLEPLLPVTNGTICLPTRQVLAIVPFVTRRALSPGLGWPGLSGGGVFPKLSKLLNQEGAWASPGYAVNPALRRRVLAGRTHAADRRNPSL